MGQLRGDAFGELLVQIANFLRKKQDEGKTEDTLKPRKDDVIDFENPIFDAGHRKTADVHAFALQPGCQFILRPFFLGTQKGHTQADDVLAAHTVAFNHEMAFSHCESLGEGASEP
jgi:hypothetical protein